MSSLLPAFVLVAVLGAGAGLRVRDRLHDAAGERRRRHARPDVRDAVHDRAGVPAAVAHDLRRSSRARSTRSRSTPSTATCTSAGSHRAARGAARAVARRCVTVLSGLAARAGCGGSRRRRCYDRPPSTCGPSRSPSICRPRRATPQRRRLDGQIAHRVTFIVVEGGEGRRQEHAGRAAGSTAAVAAAVRGRPDARAGRHARRAPSCGSGCCTAATVDRRDRARADARGSPDPRRRADPARTLANGDGRRVRPVLARRRSCTRASRAGIGVDVRRAPLPRGHRQDSSPTS